MKPVNSGADQHVLLKKEGAKDESRAFLTFSSSGDEMDCRSSVTSVEQGVCRQSVCGRGSWNAVTLSLLVSVILLGVTVLVLEVHRGRELVTMRAQLDAARHDVESLRHRILEEDLLEQLKAFEEAVYAEEEATEDDDEDEESEEGDDEYDLDYEEDDEPRHGKNMLLHSTEERHKHKSDLSQESVGRKKREIASSVVPVIPGSYGVDFNHHNSNSSEGLRLYESLVSGGGKDQHKDPSQELGTTENPIKGYHRVSSVWSSKPHHKKHLSESQQYRRHRDRSQSFTTQTPSPIISRVSRVKQTDPNDSLQPPQPPPPPPSPLRLQPQHKLPDGEVVVRVYQEQRAPETGTVSGPAEAATVTKNRQRKKLRPLRKHLAQIEGLDENPARASRLLAAVHYEGDTSKYAHGQHPHYGGNGRLRHPDGKFTDWVPSNWSQQLGMERYFKLEDGVVTVHDSGVYFIYSQIYYVDEHDINGFRVYVNDNAILHCTTMTVHSQNQQRRAKSNTCHTSAAIYLSQEDRISIRDVDGLRYSLFEPAKSFFGLVKLGHARLK